MMKQKKISLMVGLAAALLLTSCYKLISTLAPKQVEAGQTFEVSFTVVDDGSSTQNFVTDWSYAGIRLPEGWEVTMPKGAHRQFAEDWVYYSDGSQVSSQHDMVACDSLTQFYNSACRRAGYTWHAFQSAKQVPKNISACWRNGADSIRVTFLVTVPEDVKAGTYSIDFIGGDEEDAQGVSKYATLADAKSSRLFHVGTLSSSYIENKNTALSLKVKVLDMETAVQLPMSRRMQHAKGIYTLDGKSVRRDDNTSGLQPGLYYINGRKTLVR